MKGESLCKPKAESLLYAEVQPNFMERNDIKVKTENDDENADANEGTMSKDEERKPFGLNIQHLT